MKQEVKQKAAHEYQQRLRTVLEKKNKIKKNNSGNVALAIKREQYQSSDLEQEYWREISQTYRH